MSSDLTRSEVFQATKVRHLLKRDGSWIHTSQDKEQPPAVKPLKPIKLAMPATFSSPEGSPVSSQSSYVSSAIRKFETQSPSQNSPVLNDSALPESPLSVLEDKKNLHVENEEKTTSSKPQADVLVQAAVEKPIESPQEATVTTAAEAPIKVTVEKPTENCEIQSLKTSPETPESISVMKTVVKTSEEAQKSSTESPVKDVEEKPPHIPEQEVLKSSQEILESVLVETVVKSSEEAKKTNPVTPVKETVEKPTDTQIKVSVNAQEIPANNVLQETVAQFTEEPLKTNTEVSVLAKVEKPVEKEPLETSPETTNSLFVEPEAKSLENPKEVLTEHSGETHKPEPSNNPKAEVMEILVVESLNEAQKASPGNLKKDVVETPTDKPVMEPLMKPLDASKTETDVKVTEETLKKSTSTPQKELVVTSAVTCTEETRKSLKPVKPVFVSSPEGSRVTPRSSYVSSAIRKFESQSSTENSTVLGGSSLTKNLKPVLEASKKVHVETVEKTSTVKPAEEQMADTLVHNVNSAEEQLKTAEILKHNTTVVKALEEPLTKLAKIPVKDTAEKPLEYPPEEQLKTREILESKVTALKAPEQPLKKPAEVPVKDAAEKPTESLAKEQLKTEEILESKVSVSKAAEEPLKKTAEVLINNRVENPVEKHPKETDVSLVKTSVEVSEKPEDKSCDVTLKASETDGMKISSDNLKKDLVEKQRDKPVTEPLKTPSDSPKTETVGNAQIKATQETPKTSTNTSEKVEEISSEEKTVEKQQVKEVKEVLKTPGDTSQSVIEENQAIKAPEEATKSPSETSRKDAQKKPEVKPVSSEETLKTPSQTPKMDVIERPTDNSVKEPVLAPEDDVKKDTVEIPLVKPVETPKTLENAPVMDPIKKPMTKPSAEALKTQADSPNEEVVDCVIKSTDKTVRTSTHTCDSGTGDQPQEIAVKTLDKLSSEPSGAVNQLIISELTTTQEPKVEVPSEPKNADAEPISLLSALETPVSSSEGATEAIQEPLVVVEQRSLKSEAPLTVKRTAICSFCKLPLDEVKISLNIPEICCHPDCFKCNDCGSPLGDLSSPMFHYAGKVLCEKCFDLLFQI